MGKIALKNKDSYNLIVKINHWIVGILMIAMICFGYFMTSLENDHELYSKRYSLFYPTHKTIGCLLIIIVLWRLIAKLFNESPKSDTVKVHFLYLLSAKIVHYLLYIFMFLIPLSGFFMSLFSGRGHLLFGIHLPAVEKNMEVAKFMHMLHEKGNAIMVFLIAMHVGGFLFHLFFHRKTFPIIKRMF